jgi:hypothetical protein
MMRFLLCGAAMIAALSVCAAPSHAEELRPAVGKPLQKAVALLHAHKYPAAMAQVNAAAAAGGLSANESFVIQQTRAAIATAEGDKVLASKAIADLLASGRLSHEQELQYIQSEIGYSAELKNYPATLGWLNRYFKAGGNDPKMHDYLISVTYQNQDYAGAAKMESAQIAAELHARRVPTEAQLDLLAACYRADGDAAGFQNAMTNLAYYYPKPDYWENLIHIVQTRPGGLSDRLTMDIERFELAIGLLKTPEQFMELTELALQGPLPGEAKRIVDKGYADGVLGTGPQAAREKRLADLVAKLYATELPALPKREAAAQGERDGNPLVALGEEYVSYGQFPKGISLIEAGIAKDQLRHPEDTKLHLGLAYLSSGNKPKAIEVLRSVGGNEGAGEIAKLWVLLINRA